jgi:integrase
MTKTKYDGLYYRVDKNKNKVYVARIYVNGKDTTKTLGKEPQINLKTANRLRLELIEEYKNGKISTKKTLQYFFEEYVILRKPILSKDFPYKTTLNWNKYLKNEIGHILPQNVNVSKIQKILNNMLEQGKSVSTAKQIKEIVIGIYKYLPYMGVKGLENIGYQTTLPKIDNTRNIELSDDEIKRLFYAIFNYEDIKIRTIFIWLLHGRRKGEVLNIRWEDIDFVNNTYKISSEISKINKTFIYDLTDTLIKSLKEYGIEYQGLVFESNVKQGQIIGKTGMDYHWKNIRIDTGLRKLNMHDLRHIVGGFSINKGYSLEITGKVLGHTTANITQRYSKVNRTSVKNVIDDLMNTYKEK